MDEMYYQLATSLGQDYWLVMAKGAYDSPLIVDVNTVVSLWREGGERGNVKPLFPLQKP
jgi:hypothetical protein